MAQKPVFAADAIAAVLGDEPFTTVKVEPISNSTLKFTDSSGGVQTFEYTKTTKRAVTTFSKESEGNFTSGEEQFNKRKKEVILLEEKVKVRRVASDE